jgi:hypothetical protein
LLSTGGAFVLKLIRFESECLNELHRSQESSMNLRDAARQHHLTRAKIASKLIKYPHIDDYTVRRPSIAAHPSFIRANQIGLREHDEKTLYVARQNLSDLRNIYAVLFDILNKNIQKASSCSPKSMHAEPACSSAHRKETTHQTCTRDTIMHMSMQHNPRTSRPSMTCLVLY